MTIGSAAIKPPSLSLRLASSDTRTTTAAVRKYLVNSHAMMPPWDLRLRPLTFDFFLQLRLILVEINDEAVMFGLAHLFDIVEHPDLET